MPVRATNRVRPNSCVPESSVNDRGSFEILENNVGINDEDYLFMVPARRENRVGGREGTSRRCAGNPWDLCDAPSASTDSLATNGTRPRAGRTESGRKIVRHPGSMDGAAELHQEGAPLVRVTFPAVSHFLCNCLSRRSSLERLT